MNLRSPWAIAALSVALVGSSLQTASAQTSAGVRAPRPVATAPAPLRLAFTAGSTARYNSRSTNTVQALVSTTTSVMELQTTAVAANGTASQRLRMVSFDMQSPAVPAAARAQLATALAGLVMQYDQDPRGRISNSRPVTGVAPGLAPLVDGVRQSIEQLTPALPEGPVAIGATWSDSRTTHVAMGPMNMDLQIGVTYTLRQVAGTGAAQTATLGVALTLTVPNASGQRGVTITGRGTGTGTMVMLLGRGLIQSSNSNVEMDMTITARGQRAQQVHSVATSDMRLAS